MLLICGAIPDEGFPLTIGPAAFDGESLLLDGKVLPCTQGTAALVGAACEVTAYLGAEVPRALLVGDRGTGKGSRALYEYLVRNLPSLSPSVLVLHYMLPVMGLMKKVVLSSERCERKPVLVADAAAMYAAKAAGLAPRFDIFTPDHSEMAFLADPEASHPAYVSRHLFESDNAMIPELASVAHRHGGAARIMVVKGATDFIVEDGRVVGRVSTPDIPALEAIGGTGDTLTGMLSAFIHAGFGFQEAAGLAAKTNRLSGVHSVATPFTKIRQIIAAIPAALEEGFRLNFVAQQGPDAGDIS
ncbi:MAG: sugar kinase [Syntrophobacterales bacterium]|jgi:NAD(P)H-hydrate repair Nnr-like enzyme with NAD(P)H-hydrate dehydratase domain|nr:sugar kinase [Syntrophobacterales bacterium]